MNVSAIPATSPRPGEIPIAQPPTGFARKHDRPIMVIFIAGYEFLKAVLLLVLAWMDWAAHGAYLSSLSNLEDALRQNPYLLLLPAAAGLLFAVGWGLWTLRGWARLALVVVVALNVGYWWAGSIGSPLETELVAGFLTRHAAWMILLLDGLILPFMALPVIAQAFGRGPARES